MAYTGVERGAFSKSEKTWLGRNWGWLVLVFAAAYGIADHWSDLFGGTTTAVKSDGRVVENWPTKGILQSEEDYAAKTWERVAETEQTGQINPK